MWGPIKGNMKVNVDSAKAQTVNVLPLFGNLETEQFIPDPMTELLNEGGSYSFADELPPMRPERRRIVREDHFPDQGMYILDQQLQALKENLARIKYYLSDLDDLLPR